MVRPIDGHDEPRRQFAEFIALAVIRALHRATNREFAPMRMTFAHTRRSGLREIHRILRCPVEFAQTADSWVLPQSVMELPITSGDSHLLHILETHADDLLSKRRTAIGLRGLVENRLLGLLPSGKVQKAIVAQQLGMSARSFTRHLAQEGTSFGEVLDGLRNHLALRYLEDERISLQQTAWLLLFRDRSVQPRLQTVDRDIARPSEKSTNLICVCMIGITPPSPTQSLQPTRHRQHLKSGLAAKTCGGQ